MVRGAGQCSAVQYSAVQCCEGVRGEMQYSAVQSNVRQCRTVQYSAVPCSTVQYSAVQYLKRARATILQSSGFFPALRKRAAWPSTSSSSYLGTRVEVLVFSVQCSVFSVQCLVFSVECLVFSV